MILLWGLKEDTPMNMVLHGLEQSGADFIFLDHRKIFSSDIDYTFDPQSGVQCIMQSQGVTTDLSRINVVYLRPHNFRDFAEMQNKAFDDPLALKAAGFETQLLAYLDASDAVVVNRSDPSATNASKPQQLWAINNTGFKIPETFISNDKEAVKQFLLQNKEVVYKSISSVRSIVQKLSSGHMEYLDDISWCPTLFQEYLPGINYRVHVIGDIIYSVCIESDKLDYRYGNTTMIAEELPADVAEKCKTLNSILGLHFSGIDLLRTRDDEWYCFEVNTSPAYSYFELNSGLPISKSLIQFLLDADAKY